MTVPFSRRLPRAVKFRCWCLPEKDLELARAASKEFGDEVAFMLDVENNYDLRSAQRVGAELQREKGTVTFSAVKPETPGSVGHQGYGDRRVSRYFLDGPDAYVSILENSVVALMIEKKSAVDNLEAILDVGGIDMVQFGAADFSLNIGKPGQWDDPEVTAARNRVIQTSKDICTWRR